MLQFSPKIFIVICIGICEIFSAEGIYLFLPSVLKIPHSLVGPHLLLYPILDLSSLFSNKCLEMFHLLPQERVIWRLVSNSQECVRLIITCYLMCFKQGVQQANHFYLRMMVCITGCLKRFVMHSYIGIHSDLQKKSAIDHTPTKYLKLGL